MKTDFRWTPCGRYREERRPYIQCPHCREYQMTMTRELHWRGPGFVTRLLTGEDLDYYYDVWEWCHNCRYQSDHWEDSI